MASSILVTGGTGTLGRVLVQRLVRDGFAVRVLSRRPRPESAQGANIPYDWYVGDLVTGHGIDPALAGASVGVHCASGSGDITAARNLIAAARRAGAPHVIYISIVGVDRVPLRYYRTKLEVEHLIENSGLAWTVLRATQFHDLVVFMASALARLPALPVPAGTDVQPIDVRDVADRLAELARGAPAGRVPDTGGPQVRSVDDLVRSYLQASGRRRAILPVRLPGPVFRGFREGGHLAPDRTNGRITFDEFLAERFSATGATSTAGGAGP